MQKALAMRLFRVSLLALLVVSALGSAPAANAFGPNLLEMKVIWLGNSKEPYDPGKEITEDPHGPNPHGPNPHGRNPHDEIHDKNLPANDKDNYGPRW
jgi:hypothetical protein